MFNSGKGSILVLMETDLPNETLRVDLANAIHTLEYTLDLLTEALSEETRHPVWGWRTDDTVEARRNAITMIRAIDYQRDQPSGETRIYPALLGVRTSTLRLAHEVNEAKEALAIAFKAMQGRRITIDGEQRDLTRHALSFLGRLHLHFHQATRQIVICDTAPYRVGFTWLVGSARVARTSREELLDRLTRRVGEGMDRDPGILADIERLRGLPQGEPLARYRRPLPHPRANIAWRTPDGQIVRKLRPAVMPILYPAEAGQPLPKLRPLPEQPPEKPQRAPRRARQGERRVSPERFLITEPIHRYTIASPSRAAAGATHER